MCKLVSCSITLVFFCQNSLLLFEIRSRLQWAAEDWPELGRPDTRGGVLGGQVMMRLDLLNAFQVDTGSHASMQL